ncbi:MAG: hypothetical protein KatS3mg111_4078 [Pirellulaceae bacterium]|nr:MAG: hypothetical protein KatS3mg111_4078 [Pirellulaceae bacterium]
MVPLLGWVAAAAEEQRQFRYQHAFNTSTLRKQVWFGPRFDYGLAHSLVHRSGTGSLTGASCWYSSARRRVVVEFMNALAVGNSWRDHTLGQRRHDATCDHSSSPTAVLRRSEASPVARRAEWESVANTPAPPAPPCGRGRRRLLPPSKQRCNHFALSVRTTTNNKSTPSPSTKSDRGT